MYLFIFEDKSVEAGNVFSDADKQSCDDGIIEVIDIEVRPPKTWYQGEWHYVKFVG